MYQRPNVDGRRRRHWIQLGTTRLDTLKGVNKSVIESAIRRAWGIPKWKILFRFAANLPPLSKIPLMKSGLHGWRPARSTRHQTPISGHHWPSPGHRLKTPPDGGDLDRFRPIFFPTLNAHGLVVLACDLWVFSSNIHAGIQ